MDQISIPRFEDVLVYEDALTRPKGRDGNFNFDIKLCFAKTQMARNIVEIKVIVTMFCDYFL